MAATEKRSFSRLNPVTGQVATMAPAATLNDAASTAEAAAGAFGAWSALGPNARRSALLEAAGALAARADSFVSAMQAEIGARRKAF